MKQVVGVSQITKDLYKMNLDFVKQQLWMEAEKRLANKFGLTLFSANDRVMELLENEVAVSDFHSHLIEQTVCEDPRKVIEFGARWFAYCNDLDYRDEWNVQEGDQQEGEREGKTIGIGQGFLVGYALLYLYARDNPDLLLDYIKRRRIPQSSKVAKDVIKVYNSTLETSSQ